MSDQPPAPLGAEQTVGPTRDLGVVTLVAIALRGHDIQGQSFSMDEMAELMIVKDTVPGIIGTPDGFPPLFHLLLKPWLGLFGDASAARWLSVIFGVLAVAVVWRLACDLTGRRGGLFAALLVAAAPYHIWFSQEARAYSLYFLTAALALWLFFRALRSDDIGDWVLFGVAAAAGAYTHYYFVLLIATTVLVTVIDRRDLSNLRRPLVGFLVLGVLCLPVLFLVHSDLTFQEADPRKTPFGLGAFTFTYLSTITGFTIGPSIRELHGMGLGDAARLFAPWILPVGLAIGGLGLAGWRALGKSRARWQLVVFAVAPVIGAGLLALPAGYRVRYVVWILIPIAIWLGAGADRAADRWGGRALIALLLFVFAVGIFNRRYVDRYRVEDARALAAFVEQSGEEDSPILVSVEYMEPPIRHYVTDDRPVVPLPRVGSDGAGRDRALSTIRRVIGASGGAWLAYSRPFDGDPGGHLISAVREQWHARRVARFAGIELYRLGDEP